MQNNNFSLPKSYNDHLKFDPLLNYIMYHVDTDFIHTLNSLTYDSFVYNSITYKFINGQCTLFDMNNNIITQFIRAKELINFLYSQPDENIQ